MLPRHVLGEPKSRPSHATYKAKTAATDAGRRQTQSRMRRSLMPAGVCLSYRYCPIAVMPAKAGDPGHGAVMRSDIGARRIAARDAGSPG